MTPMDLILDGSAAMRRAEELQATVDALEKRARWAEELLDRVMRMCAQGKPIRDVYGMLHLALAEREREREQAAHTSQDSA